MVQLSINDIEEIVKKDESRYLELKESTGEIVKGMASGSAFLNTDGGWLMFGITNKLKIVGQQVTDSTKREIASHLRKFEPAIDIEVQYIELPNKPDFYVVAIHFDPKEQTGAPYMYDGRAYYKVESTTMVMPMDMFVEQLRKGNPDKLSWERMPNKKLSVSDLDSELMLRIVQEGIGKRRIPSTALQNVSIEEVLESLDLMEDGVLINAAVVLFGKQPRRHFLQCCLRLARFEGTDTIEFRDQTVCEGNLFEQSNEAINFCQKHMFLSGKMDKMYRDDTLTVPYNVLREAIQNALSHRSWETSNATPSIAIFDDRIEIENPGYFPRGYTWEYFTQKRKSLPHNPTIANVFYKSGTMESWGRGIQLIMSECKEQGFPTPRFEVDHSFVKLTIYFKSLLTPHKTERDDVNGASGVNDGASGANNGASVLSERESAVYTTIKNNTSITPKELSELLNIPLRSIQRVIKSLQEKGYTKRLGEKSGGWIILK